jgi:hypothetical protein
MVRLLRVVVLGLGALVILTVLVGLFLPRTWSVERSRLLRATPERVQRELEDLRTWPSWTPWSKERDPSLVITFDGPERGPGARMSWEGQVLGSGSLTITRAQPAAGVEYEIQIRGVDEGSRGAVRLAAEPAGSRVTWTDGGQLGWNPMMRLFAPLLSAKLGHDFDEGLGRLAARVE